MLCARVQSQHARHAPSPRSVTRNTHRKTNNLPPNPHKTNKQQPQRQANTRNMKLIKRHLENPRKAQRADACFLASMFFALIVLPFLVFCGIIAMIVLLILHAFQRL